MKFTFRCDYKEADSASATFDVDDDEFRSAMKNAALIEELYKTRITPAIWAVLRAAKGGA